MCFGHFDTVDSRTIMKVCKVFLTFSTLLAVVIAHHAGGYGGAYGGGLHGGGGGGGDFSGPVYYKFGYGVADPHTGDYHQQHEIRDGHVVKGAYSLKEADGTVRLVEYVAGPHSGFNAVVKRIGQAYHPQVYGVAHGGGGGGGHGGYYGGGGGGGGGQSHVKPAHFGYHY